MENKISYSGKKLPHSVTVLEEEVMQIPLTSADTPEQGVREFVFRSAPMRALYTIATQVAGSDASILVFGESGTGKELFARLIHNLSERSARPFVPVNCGILQGELFADKFFGHESGAYTGASRMRKGAFELAGSGTLFLDEVGEIPPSNQTDFLRVLEERSFRRMGGEKDIPFQARIVAATNRPLAQMVAEGSFRADLFYRLNVIPVCLPPLRSRKADIGVLAEHVLSYFRHRYHRHNLVFHEDVLAFFQVYPWPGNVRELRNLIERLVLLAGGAVISLDNLPLDMILDTTRPGGHAGTVEGEAQEPPASLHLEAAVREAEIRAIVRAYKHVGGHKGKTAEALGISPRSLRYKMAEYGLDL